MTLDQAQTGFEGPILDLRGDSVVVERLREIGCFKGSTIRIMSRLVFGEPLIVEVSGASIALRKSGAQCILV